MGLLPLALYTIGNTATHMMMAGQLHEVQKLTKQARLLSEQPGGLVLSEVGLSSSCQPELLREWNDLDAALTLAQEAILLGKQAESPPSSVYLLWGDAMFLRIHRARSELDT